METHAHRYRFETEATGGKFVGRCACGAEQRCPVEPEGLHTRDNFKMWRRAEPFGNVKFGERREDGLAW